MAAIACPECGATAWRRTEDGGYSEVQYVETDADPVEITFDNRVESDTDTGPWECQDNRHQADDELAEQLTELFG